jgi:hypothetical protein
MTHTSCFYDAQLPLHGYVLWICERNSTAAPRQIAYKGKVKSHCIEIHVPEGAVASAGRRAGGAARDGRDLGDGS